MVTGQYVETTAGGETVRAFVPDPLPPRVPLQFTEDDRDLVEKANRALGRLDGVTMLLSDVRLFMYFYVRKEAVLSSQIEGTQSSVADLLMHEEDMATGVPLDDVREVSRHVAAMDHAMKRLREDDFPLSLRLLREIHAVLLESGRGADKAPGQFRRSQNWVGGSRPGTATFVPPPPNLVQECMSKLELFLHDQPDRTPALVKAALAHVQFETIHPFLDGNGRLGRLLITLILCHEKALAEPLLYLSLYFKQNRPAYYDCLQKVRLDGDWMGWLRFFMEGVRQTADQAADTAARIRGTFGQNRKTIEQLGRRAGSALRVHDDLRMHPITNVPDMADRLQLSAPTIRTAMDGLQELGIVREITDRSRDRVYVYDEYLRLLDEGTEPL